MRIIILTVLLLHQVSLQAKTHNIDADLIDYLYDQAASLSGYPNIELSERPTIYQKTKDELDKIVCPEDPENCYQLAAVFDDEKYRIIIRSDLDMNSDVDNSFLLHEMVHALQFNSGAALYDNLDELCQTESEAYRAQNLYLKGRGIFQRFGDVLRFQGCLIKYLTNANMFN